jgi:hypothetical protein
MPCIHLPHPPHLRNPSQECLIAPAKSQVRYKYISARMLLRVEEHTHTHKHKHTAPPPPKKTDTDTHQAVAALFESVVPRRCSHPEKEKHKKLQVNIYPKKKHTLVFYSLSEREAPVFTRVHTYIQPSGYSYKHYTYTCTHYTYINPALNQSIYISCHTT